MLQFIAALALASCVSGQSYNPNCKPVSSSLDWPTASAWDRLNNTVSGRLVDPVPPGVVCHADQPQYNNASCTLLATQWHNTTFHAINPVSADYNDVTCLPDNEHPCSTSGYPRYVVQATNAHDVQQAVSFAAETGVRLIVKGTGHDFLGRSSGSDSLSIHTHGIRGLELNIGDPRAIAYGGYGSLKISAGERFRDIYAFAAERNVTVVGGADTGVGIGGWISSGGHSPVSGHYGLGADQVLEMEVVTADGVLRTVNEHRDADLFWALRGGNGGSFAVLVSITVKAYPALPHTFVRYSYNTTGDSDAFWSLTAYWTSLLPQFSEAGLMGYHYPEPNDPSEKNASISGKLHGSYFGPELSKSQVEALLAPVNEHIRNAKWGAPIFASNTSTSGTNYSALMATGFADAKVGVPLRLASRLFDGKALAKPFDELKAALKKANGQSRGLQIFNVAGKGAREPMGGIPGGSNALLPAWRSAYAHVIVAYHSWAGLNKTAEQQVFEDMRDNTVPALLSLAPDAGAYINEADPTEENWKQVYYGANYERLLGIKNDWDPKGVFWNKNGVGSDLWEPVGPWGRENGVGQNPIQLCRAS